MRKVLLLVLALSSLALVVGTSTEAATNTYCPICTTYPDGSTCCVSCFCSGGRIVACTDHFCPEP